jgi:hypothetical protein
MPAGDGTGPMGMGPRTGRAAGYCSGYGELGWANPAPGRGLGLGWGRRGGRGGGWRHRNWYYATGVPGRGRFGYAPACGPPAAPAPEEEVEFLKAKAAWLEQQLEAIGRRVQELAPEE